VPGVPPELVTLTSTAPAAWAGVVQVICVKLTTVIPAAAVPPKVTAAPLVKLLPAIATEVPPAVVPVEGVTEVTVGVGVGVVTVKVTPLEIPAEVVTVTEPVAAPAGTVELIWVLLTDRIFARIPLKLTADAPVK